MQVRRKPAIIRPASPVALVVGLATKTCAESTARYAVGMGYYTTLLAGAVATFSHDEHKAAIEFDYPRIAHARFYRERISGVGRIMFSGIPNLNLRS